MLFMVKLTSSQKVCTALLCEEIIGYIDAVYTQ